MAILAYMPPRAVPNLVGDTRRKKKAEEPTCVVLIFLLARNPRFIISFQDRPLDVKGPRMCIDC